MNRKIFFLFIILFIVFAVINGCDDDDYESTNTVYKQYMRSFVQNLSEWAKARHTGFIIIPQNGHELATLSGNEDDDPDIPYISAIDGAGQEDLFYGYDDDDIMTPASETNYLLSFLNVYEENGVQVLVTDYCLTESKMDDSYEQNESRGFISFAADHRDLDNIPGYPVEPYNGNDLNITSLSEAENFLYLLNPTPNFSGKDDFIAAIDATNYDVFIIDLFYDETVEITAADINALKTKPDGGSRLVICYMSIGEAENYRYYWDNSWNTDPPDWLLEENPDWPGNYKVKYWDPQWQAILFGNDTSYLKRILDAEFDGVYLDIIEAFEYFE